jgi:2-aminoethylphosphonate dioxygenase
LNLNLSEISRDYTEHGFVLIAGATSPDLLDTLCSYVDALETTSKWPPGMEVYFEHSPSDGRGMVRQIENFYDVHQPLSRLAEQHLKSWADLVMGEETILFKDKINFKHPGGGGYDAHRDGRFWWRHPETGEQCRGWEYYASEFVSVALFLDDADTTSGCLDVVRGKHTASAMGPVYESLSSEEAASMYFEPVEALAGDVLVMNASTPHRSGPNRSEHSRRVIYFTYNRCSEGNHRSAYFADKRLSLAAQGGAVANR